MTKDKMISVIAPCYNEEEAAPIFLREVLAIAANIEAGFEIIFVDDGSKDGTFGVIKSLAEQFAQIRYIRFSRNFGKEAAVLAGLEAAIGDFVVVMDVDLQHPPALLPQMYDGIVNEGFDSVAAKRSDRAGEPKLRSFFARRFYRLINKISDTEMVDGATDYRMMTRQMVDVILSLKEYNRFTKGLFSWVGFDTKWIQYQNVPRVAGTTKWSFFRLFAYSLEGIISFSVRPLAISSFFGILFCFLAFVGIVFLVVRWIMFGDPVQGWVSTAVLILFVGGIQLFGTGILGQYLAKSYLEIKGRPVYVVKEKN